MEDSFSYLYPRNFISVSLFNVAQLSMPLIAFL